MIQQIIEDKYNALYKENEENKKQIDNLNNIINEIQEFLKEEYNKSTSQKKYGLDYTYALVNIWNRIEELKEKYKWKSEII